MDRKTADRIARMRKVLRTMDEVVEGFYRFRTFDERREVLELLSEIVWRKVFPYELFDTKKLEEEILEKRPKDDMSERLVQLAREQRSQDYLEDDKDIKVLEDPCDCCDDEDERVKNFVKSRISSIFGNRPERLFETKCPFCQGILVPEGFEFVCDNCTIRSNRSEIE